VLSKVAGTLLKQEEEKLVVPHTDSPMNLSLSHLNQFTISRRQIIAHTIGSIFDIMPMDGPMDFSEPIRKLFKKLDSPGRVSPPPGHSPVSASHSPLSVVEEVLSLLGTGQFPISVGSITITKVPRESLSGPSTYPQMSFLVSVSSAPVSLSLTRAGTSQVFTLGSLGGGVVRSSHPPQGSVELQGMPSQTNIVVLSNHQPSECVLLSPNMGSAGQGLVLQGQPGVGGVVLSGHHQPGQVVLAPATGQPLLSHRPAPSPTSAAVTLDTDPINLSITKPPQPNPPSPSSHSPAHGKIPAPPMDVDDEDIRRSSRVGRGKRWDGRISVGSRKRRSHESKDL